MSKRVIINEAQLGAIINQEGGEFLLEYLDKNLMDPLHKYLKRTKKHYDLPGFKKLYYDYEVGKVPYITTRQAFQNPQVFKNGWVLHFTNAPLRILSEGFKGVKSEYLEQIWRTYGRGYEMSDEGYCFAFDANDAFPPDFGGIDYGKYALMFRVSGLRVTNLGDLGQAQVIFNSKMANLKECYIIKPEVKEDNYYDAVGEIQTDKAIAGVSVINPYTKKAVYKGKNLKDVIEWVKNNYRQYSTTSAFYSMDKIQNRRNTYQNYVNQIVKWYQENVEGGCVTDVRNYGDVTCTKIIFKAPIPWSRFMPFYSNIEAGLDDVADIYFGGADLTDTYIWIDNKMGPNQSSLELASKLMNDIKCITIEAKPVN